MTQYQQSKVSLIDADQHTRGTSQFAAWVRTHYANKTLVSVAPFDTEGRFAIDPLKARGYEYSGAGSASIEHGLLVGKKRWFRAFSRAAEAEAEVETLTEEGI